MARPLARLNVYPSRLETQTLVNNLRDRANSGDSLAAGELIRIALFKAAVKPHGAGTAV